jgi:hypothetical protein
MLFLILDIRSSFRPKELSKNTHSLEQPGFLSFAYKTSLKVLRIGLMREGWFWCVTFPFRH